MKYNLNENKIRFYFFFAHFHFPNFLLKHIQVLKAELNHI